MNDLFWRYESEKQALLHKMGGLGNTHSITVARISVKIRSTP
jgi:hypothetical protein